MCAASSCTFVEGLRILFLFNLLPPSVSVLSNPTTFAARPDRLQLDPCILSDFRKLDSEYVLRLFFNPGCK
jgi:hypothetical protein